MIANYFKRSWITDFKKRSLIADIINVIITYIITITIIISVSTNIMSWSHVQALIRVVGDKHFAFSLIALIRVDSR